MKSGFRADIQGLRAVAVLVVIAFHAGLPLPGGFVGVDVFFVISGFVITAMLMREWDRTGTVSLTRFYVRRAKRLTPALALVVAVTAVLAALFLSPFDQQVPAAQTGLGALALVANWVIAVRSGDYFGPGAETNPLLHTWSLSVEEQFYLAFPAILLLAWRIGRRAGRPHLVALAVVGLVGLASLAMVRGAAFGFPGDSWLIGYYSPLTRAWEFAAGAGLALTAHCLPRSRVVASGLGVAGLVLLVVSLTMIDAQTPFPGKWTLVPVLGATLVMASGSAHPDNPVSRALAVGPAVRVGDWSYSLYLWHWPMIVLAHALLPLSAWAPLTAAVLCFAPAIASYRWVEEPFRDVGRGSARRAVASVATVVVVAASLATATSLVATRVWQPAYEDGRVAAAHPGPAPATTGATPALPATPCTWDAVATYIADNGLCRETDPGATPDVVLLGDSHAEHLFTGVSEAMPDSAVAVISFRSPYMFGSPEGLDLAIETIRSSNARTVLISRKWTQGALDPANQLAPLSHTVDQLTAGSGPQVILLDDVPEFPYPVLACSHRLAPVIPTAICTQPKTQVDEARTSYLADLRAVADDHRRTRLIEIGTTLCDASRCSMLSDGEVAYSDPDHLNATGSRALAARLLELTDLASSP